MKASEFFKSAGLTQMEIDNLPKIADRMKKDGELQEEEFRQQIAGLITFIAATLFVAALAFFVLVTTL